MLLSTRYWFLTRLKLTFPCPVWHRVNVQNSAPKGFVNPLCAGKPWHLQVTAALRGKENNHLVSWVWWGLATDRGCPALAVSWLNPSWQLSTPQLPAHSPHAGTGERIGRLHHVCLKPERKEGPVEISQSHSNADEEAGKKGLDNQFINTYKFIGWSKSCWKCWTSLMSRFA